MFQFSINKSARLLASFLFLLGFSAASYNAYAITSLEGAFHCVTVPSSDITADALVAKDSAQLVVYSGSEQHSYMLQNDFSGIVTRAFHSSEGVKAVFREDTLTLEGVPQVPQALRLFCERK